jgi:dTDP-4-amino-4,6-dideoxygalactose transaminase
VHAVFHYLSLHSSPFYRDKHDGRSLPHSDRYSDALLRLPMFYKLDPTEIAYIINCILDIPQ